MQILQDSWRTEAEAKVASIKSKIPDGWVLKQDDLDMAKKQRKLNGRFFENFLNRSDIDILHNDSVQLVDKIRARHYTALEVTRAYCKAAAIAHQVVSNRGHVHAYSIYESRSLSTLVLYAEPLSIEQLFA